MAYCVFFYVLTKLLLKFEIVANSNFFFNFKHPPPRINKILNIAISRTYNDMTNNKGLRVNLRSLKRFLFFLHDYFRHT